METPIESTLLKNRRILVTRTSSGLGYAMAKALAAAGASVLLTARSEKLLQQSVTSLQQHIKGFTGKGE